MPSGIVSQGRLREEPLLSTLSSWLLSLVLLQLLISNAVSFGQSCSASWEQHCGCWQVGNTLHAVELHKMPLIHHVLSSLADMGLALLCQEGHLTCKQCLMEQRHHTDMACNTYTMNQQAMTKHHAPTQICHVNGKI